MAYCDQGSLVCSSSLSNVLPGCGIVVATCVIRLQALSCYQLRHIGQTEPEDFNFQDCLFFVKQTLHDELRQVQR